jgi:membrane-bound ClpP family serine protease
MSLIILLFALGIVLLAAEVLVPGGILGTAGGLLMFGGCVAAFVEYGMGGGLLATFAAMLLAALAFFIEFRVLPKTAMGRRLFLTAEVKGASAAYGGEAADLIGKSAVAATMLSPSGYIMIDGTRHEAFCQSGQVPAGTPLQVTGADNFRLIVSETKTTPTTLC